MDGEGQRAAVIFAGQVPGAHRKTFAVKDSGILVKAGDWAHMVGIASPLPAPAAGMRQPGGTPARRPNPLPGLARGQQESGPGQIFARGRLAFTIQLSVKVTVSL